MKKTLKLLFFNPANTYNINLMVKALRKYPIILIAENTDKSYIVDTGIEVKKK